MFPAVREEVRAALRAALDDLDWPTDDLGVEEPPEDVDAVLASSAAFRLAGEAEAPPPQVAAQLAEAIDLADARYVAAATAQGPYVNFAPSDAYFRDTLAAAQADDFGHRPDTGESVVVEHTSANPTGPVHVGRSRNPIIGDALARLLEYAGHDVEVHYYVNDAGRQMAVFTWAYETLDEEDLAELGHGEPERPGADYDLVRYYRAGNQLLEDGDPETVEAAEAEIASLLRGLDEGDEAAYERVDRVVSQVLGGMTETLERLPATFDEFIRETRFLRNGDTAELVERLQALDEAVYEEDAWQLDLSAHGVEKNLVFLRSDGTTLYATRDLAHHEWKLREYDRAVTVLGEDHELQARQVRTVLELLGHDADPLEQVLYSWVDLPAGTMSTRQGTGIDLDDLLDEAVARAAAAVRDRLDDRVRDDLTEADVERIARQVGVGAVRYDVVATQPSKGITFEWDRALDFEGQSAPFVQYAHARACGILERAAGEQGQPAGDDAAADGGAADAPDGSGSAAGDRADRLEHPAERMLLLRIARFPGVVEDAAADRAPHRMATYARALADDFNAFYRDCPVLDAEPERRAARLALVAAARTTLANALDVLGIAAPDSM